MGLRENIRSEQVSRLTLRVPVTASSDTPIRDAVKAMREKKLGCVIIIDEEQKPIGLFTERMLTQLLAQNPAVVEDKLRQHMAEPCPWVRLTDEIEDVMDALTEKNIRFLAVVDEEGKLLGLTGQKGLMEYVAEHFPRLVMVQRIGGSPSTTNREGA